MAKNLLSFLKLLLSALALLVAAQTFNAVLTLSSLERLYSDLYSAEFRIAGGDAVSKIETALRLGKPLGNFFGFDRLAEDLREDLPDLSHIALALADGRIANSAGAPVPDDLAARLEAPLSRISGRDPPAETPIVKGADHHFVVLPIEGPEGDRPGALVLGYSVQVLKDRLRAAMASSTLGLVVASALAALLLILAVRQILKVSQQSGGSGWRLLAMPAAILIVAQVAASVQSIQVFRDAYLAAAWDNTRALMGQVREDVEFLVGKGLPLDRMKGMDARLAPMIEVVPELARLSIVDARNAELYSAEASGEDPAGGPRALVSGLDAGDPRLTLSLPLHKSVEGAPPIEIGQIVGVLGRSVIEANLRERVLDAATVLLVSLFFMFEVFVLFGVAVRRSLERTAPTHRQHSGAGTGPGTRQRAEDRRAAHHLLARPVGFALLVAWAMPLSFIPLRMRALPDGGLPVPEGILLALPLSVEALFALIATLLAGRLSDRRGWRLPLFLGIALSMAGALWAGFAGAAPEFIAARGLTGLGYGLAWMGIQACIFQTAPQDRRGEGMSNLVAGFLAGFLCGTAVGAMIADRFGFETVFWLSGGTMLVPALLTLVLLRKAGHRPKGFGRRASDRSDAADPGQPDSPRPAQGAEAGAGAGAGAGGGIWRMLRDRRFLAVMALSVLPFSVAQMGLIYYTVPLYLSELNLGQSNIGRIMMIYGISVIYLGPLVARWVDRSARPRPFIVVGGLIGGTGVALLAVWGGVWMIVLAVFLLGLASGACEPARAAYVTALPSVRDDAATGAMSLQRAADRLGQMVGPLLLGSLFAVMGAMQGVALIGLAYLAASLLFILASRPPRARAG